MEKALYRKINDRTMNSSTYHKGDGTAVRAKLKQELQKEKEAASKEAAPDITVILDSHKG